MNAVLETIARDIVGAKPRKATYFSTELVIKELGVEWDCDAEYTIAFIDGADIAVEVISVSIIPRGCITGQWIAVEYEHLTEDNKLLIEAACIEAARELGRDTD